MNAPNDRITSLTTGYAGSGPGSAYSRQLRNTMRKEEIDVEPEHFSQETLDLLRERTDGAPFLLTGSRGLGGGYSRHLQILLRNRKLITLR